MEVHAAAIEESAEEYHRRRVYGPYHFALVHGVDVVDLHSHVACRALALEGHHLHIGSADVLLVADTEIGLRHLAERRESCLEIFLLSLKFEFEIACQRHIPESGNENSFRLCLRIG